MVVSGAVLAVAEFTCAGNMFLVVAVIEGIFAGELLCVSFVLSNADEPVNIRVGEARGTRAFTGKCWRNSQLELGTFPV